MGKIQVNWVSVIKEHIIKIRRKVEYMILYAVLISHFIEYFEIDTEGEVVELVKSQNEISAAVLSKIGLTKVNDDHWICKPDYDSLDHQPAEEAGGAGTSDVVAATKEGYDASMHDVPPTGYENYFHGFEERMMNQLHTMHKEERSHHQYCETRFQNIKGIIGDVQYKFGQMFYDPDE